MPSELRGQEFPEWSVTPSDRGFSIRGKRTEGVGHKPDALHTSWGATRRQRYSGARSEGAPLLTRLGAAADSQFGSVATRGKGRWLAAYLQATTTRQKPVTASERTNQVIVNNANCLVQAKLACGSFPLPYPARGPPLLPALSSQAPLSYPAGAPAPLPALSSLPLTRAADPALPPARLPTKH